jgi:hypothetical protein
VTDVAAVLKEAAEVFQQRNEIYKDAYLVVGKVTAALFPEGVTLITEEDHNRWHLLELIIVKLTRYAANWDSGHPDSMDDLMVYGAMIQALDIAKREEEELR